MPQQPENSGSIRVSVRFPCGDRFERKFNLDDSIEVHFFFFAFGNLNEMAEYPQNILIFIAFQL